MVLKMG